MVLEQDTFILAKYWFNPGRPVPVLTERLLMERKESNLTKQNKFHGIKEKSSTECSLELKCLNKKVISEECYSKKTVLILILFHSLKLYNKCIWAVHEILVCIPCKIIL